ncbi:MAG: SAM-dependent chlorinase/fluorinase, partial [Verrucomicrobia bacterium]
MHPGHQFVAVDSFGKSGKILDDARRREQPAGHAAGEDEGRKIRARRVESGRESSASRPDDDHFFHKGGEPSGRASAWQVLAGPAARVAFNSCVRVITLTTDFGATDWFVGTMKGVILGISPRAQIVDLTHEIAAGDIRAASFVLAAGCRFFPPGTIHVVVVDPGVGSHRIILSVQTKNYTFLGPDNGVLSPALANEGVKAVYQVTNKKFFLSPVSQTFHGRDLFAPVAGYLMNGVPPQKLGSKVHDFVRLEWPQPRRSKNEVRGEILYIDHFGNAISNLAESLLSSFDPDRCELLVKRKHWCRLGPFYRAARAGKA